MLSIMDGGLTARVNPLMGYSAYPEYGTRYMAAQPYMRPALNDQKKQFKSDLKRLMG
jgi:HK97 gp10 family phage protein